MKPARENALAWLLLLAVLAATLVGLWHELSITRVDFNENVLHLTLIERMAQAVQHGKNPLDFWSPEWSAGYPVLRIEQPLAHLLVVAAYFALGKIVPLGTVFIWMRFLSVALLPLSFFLMVRRIGRLPLTAAAAAMLALMVSTNSLFGMEFGSFTWAGAGLFPQAVATHFLLWSLGFAWTAIRDGKRIWGAGALLTMTILCHPLYGYMAALSAGLLAVISDEAIPRVVRLRRALKVAGIAALLALFQLVPLLLDITTINRSVWKPDWKWNSFGAEKVLWWAVTGQLLDHGRLPILTFLAAAGAGLYFWKSRGAAHRFIMAGTAFWVAMFFGRPFWGPLLAMLGASPDMQLHGVIGGAHVFLVLLAAVSLAALWEMLIERRRTALTVVLTVLVFYPMVRERIHYLKHNVRSGRANLAAYTIDREAIEASLAAARAHGGRVYAGLAAQWGGQFKVGETPYSAFLSTAQIPAVTRLYHTMALTGDVMVRFNEGRPEHYRLFNIRTVVAPAGLTPGLPEFLLPREQFGRFRVLEAPSAGYFDVVDAGSAVSTTRASFYEVNDRWLQSDWVGKRVHLLLDWHGAPPDMPRVYPYNDLPLAPSFAQQAGQVRDERQTGEVYQAELAANRPSYALFKMTWHRNWRAKVDGMPAPTVMLSPGFIGVALTPGTHRLELQYEPEKWKWMLAIFGMLASLVLGRAENSPIKATLRLPSRQVLVWGGLILLALPVCIPLLTGSVVFGHDAFSYFTRVVEVHENVRHGIVFPRWAPDLDRGTGQPLFLFHPPMFYWLAEFWHLLGFPFVTGVNLACIVVVLASAASMYLLGRLYFGESGGGLAAAAYLYSPYFATNLYIRSALEEFTAFAFLPLVLYGFGGYARRRKLAYLLVGAAAYTGVLFSHLPATLLFTPLLLGFCLLTAWIEKSWRILLHQAFGFLLALGLGAAVWMPVVFERQFVSLGRAVQGYANYAIHFVYLRQLFYSPWGYGYSVEGPLDGMPFAVGWSHMVLMLVAWVWIARRPPAPDRRLVWFCGIVSVMCCVLMLQSSAVVWALIKPLQFVQLPWRLLSLVTLAGAIMVAALSRAGTVGIAVAMGLLIVPNLPHLAPGRTQDIDPAFWTPQELARAGFDTTMFGELMPRWMQAMPRYNPKTANVVSGTAQIRELEHSPFFWSGEIGAQGPATLRISRAYFPGWSVNVDGHPAAFGPSTPDGLIEFAVPPGSHSAEVSWGRSRVRRAGDGVSLASLVVLVAAVFAAQKRAGPRIVDPTAGLNLNS